MKLVFQSVESRDGESKENFISINKSEFTKPDKGFLSSCSVHQKTNATLKTRFLIFSSMGKQNVEMGRLSVFNNMKVDIRETGINGAKWIQVAQNRVQWWAFVNTVMNLRVP
jgi:hypothetical protein